jgi:hypothetical protein
LSNNFGGNGWFGCVFVARGIVEQQFEFVLTVIVGKWKRIAALYRECR